MASDVSDIASNTSILLGLERNFIDVPFLFFILFLVFENYAIDAEIRYTSTQHIPSIMPAALSHIRNFVWPTRPLCICMDTAMVRVTGVF